MKRSFQFFNRNISYLSNNSNGENTTTKFESLQRAQKFRSFVIQKPTKEHPWSGS